ALASTVLPCSGFGTRRQVPKGGVRCAAVSVPGRRTSPLAVFRPYSPGPYQEASPSSPAAVGRTLCAQPASRSSSWTPSRTAPRGFATARRDEPEGLHDAPARGALHDAGNGTPEARTEGARPATALTAH